MTLAELVPIDEVIDVVLTTLDARDPYTYEHSFRVAFFAERIAAAMPLASAMRRRLHVAAHLHDIGKIVISDRVLNKLGRLTYEERIEIQRHPRIGFNILRRLPVFDDVATIVLHHHERMDGNGYPSRLVGEAIPLESRIIAVSDALDAMLSDRPYRRAVEFDTAIAEIDRHAGEQFDPAVVAALNHVSNAMAQDFRRGAAPKNQGHHAYVGHEDLMHSRIVDASQMESSGLQSIGPE